MAFRVVVRVAHVDPCAAIYQPVAWLDCYAGYDSINESYLLVDRPVDNDRFYYYQQQVAGGVQFKFPGRVTLDFSAGYAFDRYYFEGTGFRVSGVDRVDVGNGPFLGHSCGHGFNIHARERNSPLRVSTLISSPWARYSGTCTTRPVWSVAGLVREVAEAAFSPDRTATTLSTTATGS